MDLSIEQHGTVSGWEPAIGEVLSPGFKATMACLSYANGFEDVNDIGKARVFIDKLEDEGYCVARYTGE